MLQQVVTSDGHDKAALLAANLVWCMDHAVPCAHPNWWIMGWSSAPRLLVMGRAIMRRPRLL